MEGGKDMKKLKRAMDALFDVFEVYLPGIAFAGVFVTYIVMIVYRYIFKAQLNWVYELSMICFVWLVILAASYSSRKDDHIMFTMLYDRLPEVWKSIFRVAGNLAVTAAFIVLLPHAYDAVSFLRIKKSSLLKIPFNLIYAPFVVYTLLTIIHHFMYLVRDISGLLIKEGKK